MSTWAERLSTELLHTPKRERAKLIAQRSFEVFGNSVCSYCGERTDRAGKTLEEFNAAILEHIIGCEKRPELKLLPIAVAAQEVVDAFLDGSEDGYQRHSVALQVLKQSLDALKVKPEVPA